MIIYINLYLLHLYNSTIYVLEDSFFSHLKNFQKHFYTYDDFISTQGLCM